MKAPGKAGTIAMSPIENPDVGGVRFRKHPLEIEAGRLNQIAHRLGNRLLLWLRETEEQPAKPGMARKPKMIKLERVVGRDMESGKLLREPVIDANGSEMLVPILPDEDFRDTFQLYERAVRNLLVEQRARAAMGAGKGGAPIDDAAFNAGLTELARETIKNMPIAELRELLKARAIDVDIASPIGDETMGNPARAEETGNVTIATGDPKRGSEPAPVSVAANPENNSGGNGDFLPGLMGDDDDE